MRLRSTSDRDFMPDHEFRAIQARVRDHFSGSALALIRWIDSNHLQRAMPACPAAIS